MNTQQTLTRESMSVNGGLVRPAEQPMWLGMAVLPDGSRQQASVTYDRTYIWIRFAGGQLSDTMHAHMNANGWNYSKKKRLGYWYDNPTMEQVKLVRGLGYHGAQLPSQNPVPVTRTHTTVPQQGGNLSYELPDRQVSKAKRTTTTASNGTPPKYRMNKAGRWMDGVTGKLVTNAEVDEWLAAHQAARPNVATPQQTAPSSPDSASYLTYQLGYEDGCEDAENGNVPDTYSRMEMARNSGITVAKLLEVTDDDYVTGYLDGFAAIRPPVVKSSRLAARIGR